MALILVFGLAPWVWGQTFPPSAKTLIEAYEKKVAATREMLGKDLQALRESVVQKLKAVQQKLALEEKLEEAIHVRGAVRHLEAEKDTEQTKPFPPDLAAKLPNIAQAVLIEQESPGNVELRLDGMLAESREALRVALLEVQTKLATAEKLDEALVVRNWVRANLTPAGDAASTEKPGKLTSRDITTVAADLAALRRNHSQAFAEIWSQHNQVLGQFASQLSVKLKGAEAAHSKAGEIEEAIAIRNRAKARQSRNAAGEGGLAAQLAAHIAGGCSKAGGSNAGRSGRRRKEFPSDQAKAGRSTNQAAGSGGSPGADGGRSQEVAGAVDRTVSPERAVVSYDRAENRRNPPKVSAEIAKVLEEFNKEKDQRWEAANESSAKLRSELLTKLQAASERNLKANEELVLDARWLI